MRAPQFPQKRSSALTCVPHEGQNRTFDMGITVRSFILEYSEGK